MQLVYVNAYLGLLSDLNTVIGPRVYTFLCLHSCMCTCRCACLTLCSSHSLQPSQAPGAVPPTPVSQNSSQPSAFKFSVHESIDRIKEEFSNLQNQNQK